MEPGNGGKKGIGSMGNSNNERAWIRIEYEDGTICEGDIPEGSILHHADWIDWIIQSNDPFGLNRPE
jgi:hypothetical protein